MQGSVATQGTEKKKRHMPVLIILVVAVILLRLFVFTPIRVKGPSMENTLYTGDNIIVEKLSYAFSEPERFDIVVCRFNDKEKNYVKRIIGLPGDTIEIGNGVIFINDRPLEGDAHANGSTFGLQPKMHIPEGQYYVMGDNRMDSLDSVSLGTVDKSDIVGRGVARIWPLNKIGLLTD